MKNIIGGLLVIGLAMAVQSVASINSAEFKPDLKCIMSEPHSDYGAGLQIEGLFGKKAKLEMISEQQNFAIRSCAHAGQYSSSVHLVCPGESFSLRLHIDRGGDKGTVYFDANGDTFHESSLQCAPSP